MTQGAPSPAYGTRLLVVQPTPFCNVSCKYCYLPNRSSTRQISERTLRQTFRLLFSSPNLAPDLTVLWHAGEPLVLPPRFYASALQILKEENLGGTPYRISIQTNATLITKEWCDLFRRERFEVGVSIDGPKFLHDANRVDRQGAGTFERAMQGIRILQSEGVPFGLITVLTEKSLDYPEEIFRFYVENKIDDVAFNIEEIEGIHRTSSLERPGIEARFRRFIRRLLELRATNARAMRIREFDSLTPSILRSGSTVVQSVCVPLEVISVDCDGNVSTFSPELLGIQSPRYRGFVFGNVHSLTEFSQIEANPSFRSVFQDLTEGVRACRSTCEYFELCGGGSPSNKLGETGTLRSTETLHCRLTVKSMVDALLDHLESSLAAAASPATSLDPSAGRAVRHAISPNDIREGDSNALSGLTGRACPR